jgi:CheY-like chemotaxis protein
MRSRTISGALAKHGLVVVVDDEEEVRELVGNLLQEEGYGIASFSNGKQAIEYLLTQDQRPKLVVTDLAMPVMDGWDLVKAIQQNPELASIPVMIVTGSRRQAKIVGVPVVEKPIDPERLLGTVRDLCGTAQARRLPQQA